MAKLILTEEEKKAASFIEWDDATIGKRVKELALKLMKNHGYNQALFANTAVLLLVGLAHELDSEKDIYEIEDVTVNGDLIGSWRITVELCVNDIAQPISIADMRPGDKITNMKSKKSDKELKNITIQDTSKKIVN